ncbi:MAG: FGGY family carbohydrate kinase, partial [Pseudomonadota bacterium]
MLFDANRDVIAESGEELRQIYPRQGWVEHDPEEIWQATLDTAQETLRAGGAATAEVAAIGLTNQRETMLLWDRATGKPLHNAIVWQDRRTAPQCQALREKGAEDLVRARTGLLLDPYFSATKLAWLLDHVDGARERAAAGELAAGTVDSFLHWRLTGGTAHLTDATNACRTLLFDIHRQCWDEELLELFDIPAAILPTVLDCVADYGTTDPAHFGGQIRIGGIAGDQQAATV